MKLLLVFTTLTALAAAALGADDWHSPKTPSLAGRTGFGVRVGIVDHSNDEGLEIATVLGVGVEIETFVSEAAALAFGVRYSRTSPKVGTFDYGEVDIFPFSASMRLYGPAVTPTVRAFALGGVDYSVFKYSQSADVEAMLAFYGVPNAEITIENALSVRIGAGVDTFVSRASLVRVSLEYSFLNPETKMPIPGYEWDEHVRLNPLSITLGFIGFF